MIDRACVPLPAPGCPSRITIFLSILASSPANPALLQETVIVTHDKLRLDHLNSIHCHSDNNQQRRATEIEIDTKALRNPWRQTGVQSGSDKRNVLHVESGDEKLRNNGNQCEVKRAD